MSPLVVVPAVVGAVEVASVVAVAALIGLSRLGDALRTRLARRRAALREPPCCDPDPLEPPAFGWAGDTWTAMRARFPRLTPRQLAAILERRAQEHTL